MTEICKECGCTCNSCFSGNNLDLHHEIEELRSKLITSQNHVTQMEREFISSRDYAECEINKLQDELTKLRDRYDRLFESHKQLQKVNHNLEDKLLTIVVEFDEKKTSLEKGVIKLNNELKDARVLICDLEEESEKYRIDCNTAVQLLQCNPSNFVAHRLVTLPLELQQRVKSHLTRQELMEMEESQGPTPPPASNKMIRVPMSTFPPTAMVYSINKLSEPQQPPPEPKPERQDTVQTDIIARVLAQPKTSRKPRRVFVCDKCKDHFMLQDQETQTIAIVPYMDSNPFQRNLIGSRMPQNAILIQPTVYRQKDDVGLDIDTL